MKRNLSVLYVHLVNPPLVLWPWSRACWADPDQGHHRKPEAAAPTKEAPTEREGRPQGSESWNQVCHNTWYLKVNQLLDSCFRKNSSYWVFYFSRSLARAVEIFPATAKLSLFSLRNHILNTHGHTWTHKGQSRYLQQSNLILSGHLKAFSEPTWCYRAFEGI